MEYRNILMGAGTLRDENSGCILPNRLSYTPIIRFLKKGCL